MVVASDFDLNRDETNSIAREDGAGTRARGLTKTFHERLRAGLQLSLIHISKPTRRYAISYAVFCLK